MRWLRRLWSEIPRSSRKHFSDSSGKHVVNYHNGFAFGRIDYVRGWAYQQYLLDQRLREQTELSFSSNNCELNNDVDRILLFEHNHVYTLGRGANEENLTFLDQIPDGDEARYRLSRKTRGSDSCRLGAEIMKAVREFSNFDYTLEEAVNQVEPPEAVYAPNGVPIYRIDRGGEVTYHGPGQLVVYPLLNLRREPYKKDLHWYLRNVEEVVIQVLQEYSITGVRDDINTGKYNCAASVNDYECEDPSQ